MTLRSNTDTPLARQLSVGAVVDWIIHRQVAVGPIVMNERTDRFGKDGKWMDLPVAGVFEGHDGRITLWRDYFDLATFTNAVSSLS